MDQHKYLGGSFILIALGLGALFYSDLVFPADLSGYFRASYYNQFGPIAICVELLLAGYFLFRRHPRANFALALFGFTAVLDPLFNLAGLFTSLVPLYATILFLLCAAAALWVAFTNAFGLGRLSIPGAVGSFLLGNALELFFNSW